MTALLFATLLSGCVAPLVPTPGAVTGEGGRVLVVMNGKDPDSLRIGRYYAAKRGVPKENLVILATATEEGIPQARFASEIEAPVRAALAKTKNPVDFLLFVRGVPIRVDEGGYSVDSLLMSSGVTTSKLRGGPEIATNPYCNQSDHFTRAEFGIYLACRLDGYTVADAMALVDRSLAAKRSKGPFLFDAADNRKAESYGQLQATLGRAATALRAKGLKVDFDETPAFMGSPTPVAGYASWGSNDGAFDVATYHKLRFQPGAICETFVSTSGRTFRPTTGGQSLVADLVAQGATGVKGYVDEPYTIALAHADILFDRYTAGYNLAESFYAASPVTHWKDVVIGDPLCAPYKP